MAKKYIDAEKLTAIANVDNYSAFMAGIADRTDLQAIVDDAPAADVAEVVRCKDCKHFTLHSVCTNEKSVQTVVNGYDYCSKGEKIDGGDRW